MSNEHIFVVEDEPKISGILRDYLVQEGYTVEMRITKGTTLLYSSPYLHSRSWGRHLKLARNSNERLLGNTVDRPHFLKP